MSSIIRFLGFMYLSLWNHILNKVPSYNFRYYVLKYLYRLKMGRVNIHLGVKFWAPWRIAIEDNVNIQYGAFIDGRGGLKIGNNVDICPFVKILTLSHNVHSVHYEDVKGIVVIEDDAVIFSYALICPNVKISRGSIVGAGSVVVKDTIVNSIVAGNPARHIKNRAIIHQNKVDFRRPFH